ncbi:hypothetical protein [Pseudoalteromonas viridis]|uniref:Uncharacterized protein n=1 Tax=Pseudoalteromonas viridis TaxID=339617 RepID=A0ABX7VBA1_9GAMM|nr:hypothetical protein [Pseudoalteromonas viridis]QTL37740.1 hypothetical protein J5X90_23170 [Pseudoalteromonas viridis]
MQFTLSKRVNEFYLELNAEQFDRSMTHVGSYPGYSAFTTIQGIELTRYRVGGGFIFDLDTTSAIDVGLLLSKNEYDFPTEYWATHYDGSSSNLVKASNSINVAFRDLRVQYQKVLFENLSLKAAVGYEHLSGDAPNNLYGLLAVGYHFNQAWSVNTQYRYVDEYREWGVNVQYAF